MIFCPRWTPGSVSTSKPTSRRICSEAKLRIWAWQKSMSSISEAGSARRAAWTSSADSRKLLGSQPSNFLE